MIRPLSGIRVMDFGIITAGASTSAMLADLGAEVIKLEGPEYIDPFRVWTGVSDAERWWNESPHYSFTNRNKRSVCVDLKTEAGLKFVRSLARKSDLVVENFRVGALDRLGLGFQALSELNPDIVLASISSQGATGPESGSVSFGSTLEASSGLSSLIKTDTGIPLISGHALNYPDQVVSILAAGMILCALIERENGAGPIHLDISQRELTAYMLGEYIAAGSGKAEAPDGPGAPAFLQDVVQSKDGAWWALTVTTPAMAARIATALSLEGPLTKSEISAWARSKSAAEACGILREAGALAEIARTSPELLDIVEAGSFAFAQVPDGTPVKGLPWHTGNETLCVDRVAPDLGADNEYVACQVLGMKQTEYRVLVNNGILTSEPRTTHR